MEYSQNLADQISEAGEPVELYLYDGDDHNISRNIFTALGRSIAFFDRYVKDVS